MSSALKNLAALKRNITRRIKQALEDLRENLDHEGYGIRNNPVPARIPVTVPVGGRSRGFRRMNFGGCTRNYSTFFGANHSFGWSCRSMFYHKFGFFGRNSMKFRFQHFRFMSQFCPFSRFGQHFSPRGPRMSLMAQNFTARSHYHSSNVFRLYNVPTLTHLSQQNYSGYGDDDNCGLHMGVQNAVGQLLMKKNQGVAFSAGKEALDCLKEAAAEAVHVVPSTIRVNLSCSPKYHEIVKRLAGWVSSVTQSSEDSSVPHASSASRGVYVDFKFGPRMLVPETTVLSADVVEEMIGGLQRYQQKLAEVQQDLARLSELGELPVQVLAEEGVIRVFFPNCDRERLEMLLVEKNVSGGVIHEGDPGAGTYDSVISSESFFQSEYDFSDSEGAGYPVSSKEGASGGTGWYLSTFTSSDAGMPSPSLDSGSTASSGEILSSSSEQKIVHLDEPDVFQNTNPPSLESVHIVEAEPMWAM
ncbi:hypothetical protein FDK38_001411 [Candidozyma auris]|nr:hypothetical protein FDK38_001411 [[Candida] auris]